MRDEGTSQKKECEFPFRFLGKTYYGCIDFIEIRNGRKIPGKPWCSTKVSGLNRKHVSGKGHYGDCNSSCESAEEAEKRLKGGIRPRILDTLILKIMIIMPRASFRLGAMGA